MCQVLLVFATESSSLERRFQQAIRLLPADGGLWLAWPKKSSNVATDLDEGTVRRVELESGLVDNKICAIDNTWSSLRFVVRTANRATWG